MKINENRRKSTKIYENLRKSMKIDENQRKSTKINENLRKSMKIDENQKNGVRRGGAMIDTSLDFANFPGLPPAPPPPHMRNL